MSMILICVLIACFVGVSGMATVLHLTNLKQYHELMKQKEKEKKEFVDYTKRVEEVINNVKKMEESIHTDNADTNFNNSLDILHNLSGKDNGRT